MDSPSIGIIGGSGLYSLLEGAEEVDVKTKYGSPSDKISVGKIGDTTVAFLPRHGKSHTIPPHKINYKANIEALSNLGCERIISTTAVGSLREDFSPGTFLFPDQFINFTNRDDTFFDGPQVAHVSTAYPYCNQLRGVAVDQATKMHLNYNQKATLITINGPRFSTKAESHMFSSLGADIINMTQYPEASLAREKALCYFTIAVVTDYDAGLEDKGVKPVSSDEVNEVFGKSVIKLKDLIKEIVLNTPKERTCECSHSLDNAFISK